MVSRREYSVGLLVNGRRITKVIIDPHYKEKHSATINDELILGLVHTLDNNVYPAAAIDEQFEYFVVDKMKYNGKSYKLVWLLEKDKMYIGVVNAYRR